MVQLKGFLLGLCLVALEVIVATAEKDPFAGFPPMNSRKISKADENKHPKRKPRKGQHRGGFIPPATFDSATKWPQCESIKTIRQQGACGDCWAVSAASVISDRLCIASGKQDFISGTQVAGCTDLTKSARNNCDAGGLPADAYQAAVLKGFATGGEYQSTVGCVPYTIGTTTESKQNGVSCASACTNSKYGVKLPADTTTHQIDSYWTSSSGGKFKSQADIDAMVLLMQEDIFNNGPITAHIIAWSDFMTWKSTNGAYRGPGPKATLPPGSTGGHAVRITGWGVDKNKVKYWIIANSWGTAANAGEKGYYWVEMGKDVIEIEQSVSAPIISLAKVACSNAKFCSAPLDQALKMEYKNPASPMYLFQGECMLEVKRDPKTNKLSAVGQAMAIGKKLVNAPKPTIATVAYFDGFLTLLNSEGKGGRCTKDATSGKYACDDGRSADNGVHAFTATPSGKSFVYQDGSLYVGAVNDGSMSGYPSTKYFDAAKFKTVTQFLDIDGTNAYVFGTDASGKLAAGIMTYPSAAAITFPTPAGPLSNLLTC